MYDLDNETIDHILCIIFGVKNCCGHKKKHKNMRGAKKALEFHQIFSREIYHCIWCENYHLGTPVSPEAKKTLVFNFFNIRMA
jgi:hypothetical protein